MQDFVAENIGQRFIEPQVIVYFNSRILSLRFVVYI
jgi:hypothetical protein